LSSTADRAAVYARVSTEQQIDGTSLDAQVERCQARVVAEGWRLAGTFVDAGVSGAKASRPELDRLMSMVRRKEIDAIVVTRLDRFGRSQRHLSATLGELDDHGVRLVSLAESFDSGTPAGRMMRTLLGSFAEFERESITERMAAGQRAVARAGWFPGGSAPFGWRVERADGHARLCLDDTESATLRRMIGLILDEQNSAYHAARVLNAEGLLQRNAGRWTHNGLRRTLRTANGLSGRWIYRSAAGAIEVAIPPLISIERHAALQEWLASTSVSHARRSNGPAYMLTSKLTCQCGRPMHGVSRSNRPIIYRCADNRTEAAVRCSATNLDARQTEDRVWAEVTALLTDRERIEQLANIAHEKSTLTGLAASESTVTLARKIARVERALGERIGELLAAGRSDVVIGHATAVLEADLSRLRAKRATADAWEKAARSSQDRATHIAQLVENAQRTLRNPTPEVRRSVVELLDLRVIVTGYDICGVCHGKGVILDLAAPVRSAWNGNGAPATCPECQRLRMIPRLHIEGVIPDALSLERRTPTAAHLGGFRLVG